MGTKVRRSASDGVGEGVGTGEAYDYLDLYWRVRYPNGEWLEFSSREMRKSAIASSGKS